MNLAGAFAFDDQTLGKDIIMADDKSKQDGRDRAKVSSTEQYEVQHFAEKHGISNDKARDIIKDAGNSREKADAAASQVSK